MILSSCMESQRLFLGVEKPALVSARSIPEASVGRWQDLWPHSSSISKYAPLSQFLRLQHVP